MPRGEGGGVPRGEGGGMPRGEGGGMPRGGGRGIWNDVMMQLWGLGSEWCCNERRKIKETLGKVSIKSQVMEICLHHPN